MNYKFLGFVLFILLVSFGCKQVSKKNTKISGSFSNMDNEQLYIYQFLPASQPLIDSVRTDNTGNFSIELTVNRTGFFILRNKPDNEIILILTAGEQIQLTGDGASLPYSYSVKGSEHSALFAEYNRFTVKNLRSVDSLSAIFAESRENPDFLSIKNKLDDAYLSIFNKQKEEVITFVNNHPSSLASLLAASRKFGPNPLFTEKSDPELFIKLDSALMVSFPENSFVNTLHLKVLEYKAEQGRKLASDSLLKPGMPAPEIELPDVAGKIVTLSSCTGKLTLIYFWSSWDALSRQTNLTLAALYNKHHTKGFEIYAVSFDSEIILWHNACLIDKAYWINVNDKNGLASEYSKKYNVKSLPYMILIDGNGKIIRRNPELAELDGMIKKNL